MTAQEKQDLEEFLRPAVKDAINPFAEGSLTDETIIRFVGYNLALGLINTDEFGDKVQTGADIVFNRSVMNDLAQKYFGVQVKNHQTVDFIVYAGEKYTVPALGGVVDYPQVRLLLKDAGNKDIYYAIVDYVLESPSEGEELAYQHLIKLQKNDPYTIKGITAIEYPLSME